MALTQRLEFRQSQSLVMTPQLMQAIKLLQLSNLDLAAFVEEELERNPLLERASDSNEPPVPGEPTPERAEFSESDGGQGDDTGADYADGAAGSADGSEPAQDDWMNRDLAIGRAGIVVTGVFTTLGRRFARDRRLGAVAGALKQRISLKFLFDKGRKVEIRQLQELDRLHQLRRHHQRLGLAEL